MTDRFQLVSPYSPAGDQPAAIDKLVASFEAGLAKQTLLGVTGSGKTYTIANVIQQVQKPTLVMAPNKTLAAQLYGEFKSFFPHNAVEYFVSYYDYYQPEAYVPSSDTFIEKDSSINEHIEQMRLSATKTLLSRRDSLVVATVSAIYGLGAPEDYLSLRLILSVGEHIDQRQLIRHLTDLQYTRNEFELTRGAFRVRGEVLDVFPAESDTEALRIELFDGDIEQLTLFDPLTGETLRKLQRYTVYPKTHYATTRERTLSAVDTIKDELKERLEQLYSQNKLVEAQRLAQRTQFDLEMMAEVGFCNGIENYSRHLTGKAPGEPPPTLFDYLPPDALLVIDESHVTIPQIGAMYKGDRSRKETLVEFGFRLPSALDNRPLRFEEWEARSPRSIYVSATPGPYELRESAGEITELVVRPTGLIDPVVEIRPVGTQVDDLMSGNPRAHQARRPRVGDDADQAHVREPHRVPRRARHSRALSAFGYRHGGARGDHPRPAPGQVRCAGRHQSPARRPGYAGSVAGGDPGCGQGRLPALHRLADSDHRPRRAQPARQGHSVCRQDHAFDAGGDRRDRPPPREAGRVQPGAWHHAQVGGASDLRHHGRCARGCRREEGRQGALEVASGGGGNARLPRDGACPDRRQAQEPGAADVPARQGPGVRGGRADSRPDPKTQSCQPGVGQGDSTKVRAQGGLVVIQTLR